jgi:hypothetical protein
MKSSTALPIAYVTLRILIVLNWLLGAAIFALLAYSILNEPWMIRALGVSGFAGPRWVIMAMRGIAALGLVAIGANYQVLKRLLAIIVTVRNGDPFVAENAYRLNAIGWFLLVLQILSLVIAAIGQRTGNSASRRASPSRAGSR